jgi:nucleotide-binding universal stress UspA family protein
MSSSGSRRDIVVCADGSPSSEVAVEWAAREAAMRGLPLALCHVAPALEVQMWPAYPLPDDYAELQAKRGREVLAEARKVAEGAIADVGAVNIETDLVVAGVLPALIDRSKDAEMIVVGCRGLGPIARRLLGSVSRGLLQNAHCPVAIIHEELPGLAHAPVVVGVDGSPASETATALAFDEASRRGVELVAVHAWSDFAVDALPGVDWSDLETEAEETLSERLSGWQEDYPDVKVRPVVVLDNPAHCLVEQSKTAQLTVVGSHGRGGFARVLLGSVSSAVAESARTPVIVTRSS